MRTFNKTLTTNQALNVSSNSVYIPLRNIFMCSISFIVTGAPTGTVKLQASNDPDTNEPQTNASYNLPPSVAPTNWVDIANSSFVLSSAGSTMWNITDIAYNFIRVVYTDSSGGTSTATAKIIFNGKGV